MTRGWIAKLIKSASIPNIDTNNGRNGNGGRGKLWDIVLTATLSVTVTSLIFILTIGHDIVENMAISKVKDEAQDEKIVELDKKFEQRIGYVVTLFERQAEAMKAQTDLSTAVINQNTVLMNRIGK